jgi:hypothetical protein
MTNRGAVRLALSPFYVTADGSIVDLAGSKPISLNPGASQPLQIDAADPPPTGAAEHIVVFVIEDTGRRGLPTTLIRLAQQGLSEPINDPESGPRPYDVRLLSAFAPAVGGDIASSLSVVGLDDDRIGALVWSVHWTSTLSRLEPGS